MSSINWPDALSTGTQHFRELLRFDTTNPPGNERLAVDYIAGGLRAAGIEPLILESAPGRANLVARLKGDGSLPPLLLMGHVDVVSAEPDKWTHPPFSGDCDAAGQIFGRGAVDMKNTVAAHLMSLLLLKQRVASGQPLKRDVIFLALADEETGGEFGAQWMAREHAHLISDAEYALNEGGGGVMVVNGQRYITIQAGEKGTSRFYLRARGKPGHGSVPQPEASIVRLAAAVQRLGSNYLPVHLTQTVRSSLAVLMQTQPPAVAAMFADLLQTGDADRIVPQLPMEDFERRMLQAQLRNTAMPTIFRAGRQLNVIPDFAEAGIDGRLLPGCTRAEFHAELLQVLGDAGRDVQLEWHPHFGPALETESAGPLTNIIREVLAETDPALHLLPTLVTGGTDAKAFVPLGIKVLGYSPQPPTDTDTFNRAHAHDERLHTDSFHYCVRNTFEIVERFVTRSA